MSIPTHWHHWEAWSWEDEASEWSDMWYYHTCPRYDNYWLNTHEEKVDINHFVAIRLIEEKCNALQTQIDDMGEGGEVDMDAILEAMWDSDKLRWFHFINYIDSMRAGIWNTEIYAKHLEEWYRHFSA